MSSPHGGGARTGAPFFTIEQVIAANRAAGHFFFESGAMQFFNSTIYPRIYSGRYFATSEFFDLDSPEAYTIRVALDNGRVESVGPFQGFASLEILEAALAAALRGGIETVFDPYEDVGPLCEADANPAGFHWRPYLGDLPIGVRTDLESAARTTEELRN